MKNQSDKEPLNEDARTISYSSWIFGVIFCFIGFVEIVSSSLIVGVAFALMGLILLPPIKELAKEQWGFELTKGRKALLFVGAFFLFAFTMRSTDSTQKTQEAVTNNAPIKTEEVKTNEMPSVVTEQSPAEPITPIPKQEEPQKTLYSVVKVVDGDTLAVEIDGKQEVLRLIGINTPETVDPRKPVECFGKEASNKAKEILTGKKVSLESDPTQGELDKYNRLLRYVYLEDGTNFNKMMIEEGYAYEHTYNTPYKYQSDFKDAQKKAESEKKGLWRDDACSEQLNKAPVTIAPVPVVASPTPATTKTVTQPKSIEPATGTCAGKRTCGQMSDCKEAYFYLNTCGVSGLDRDKDGIPCETICN